MLLTEQLVQGVDVWINTPRRPWEACGTSGMKVLVNGGLNLSELDGWWAEAYTPEVGWALGDGREHGESAEWDQTEARGLLDLLEQQVVPEFYERDAQGIPRAWVTRIRRSMATLTAAYSANRSVREYVEHCYLPAAAAYQERARNGGEQGTQIVNWRAALAYNWPSLRFGAITVETHDGQHHFRVPVHLGALSFQSVSVELYADTPGQGGPLRLPLTHTSQPAQSSGDHLYVGSVAADRQASEYTARIVPNFPGVSVPLEAAYILWQH
jgi:glycogen phosphorylase